MKKDFKTNSIFYFRLQKIRILVIFFIHAIDNIYKSIAYIPLNHCHKQQFSFLGHPWRCFKIKEKNSISVINRLSKQPGNRPLYLCCDVIGCDSLASNHRSSFIWRSELLLCWYYTFTHLTVSISCYW